MAGHEHPEFFEVTSSEELNIDKSRRQRSSEHPATEQKFSNQKFQRVSAVIGKEQRSRVACKIAIHGQWLKEHCTEPPRAIWQNNFNVHFSHHDTLSISDLAKTYVELFSGQNWDWWPLIAPRRPVELGKVRVQWLCVSCRRLNAILKN